MSAPGLPGSGRPAGDDWMAQELRARQKEIERLQGQLAAAKAKAAAGVVDVDVVGSVLRVTFGDGTVRTRQLP